MFLIRYISLIDIFIYHNISFFLHPSKKLNIERNLPRRFILKGYNLDTGTVKKEL
jgi:hypothetical protein